MKQHVITSVNSVQQCAVLMVILMKVSNRFWIQNTTPLILGPCQMTCTGVSKAADGECDSKSFSLSENNHVMLFFYRSIQRG